MRKLKTLPFFLSLFVFGCFSLFLFSSQAFAATILLDPGHSATSKGLYDDPYGIYDDDYPNQPEITEVMDIATWLNQKLTAAGYKVIMTKSSWDSPSFVSLWDRAQQANKANVDLAVSIHDDHGQSWSNFAQVYVQKTNLYRVDRNGRQVSFGTVAGASAGSIATKSQQYGAIFAQQRTAAEGHTVVVTDVNFAGRAPLAAGNITQVQLYAKVPWVYNEVGGSGINTSKYEQGLLSAIEKAVPSSGGNSTGSGNNGNSNCVVTKIGNPPGQPQLPASCTSSSTGGGAQAVVALARQHLAGSYIWGAPPRDWASENPNGHAPTHFDCSGFAGWVWYWATNGKVNIPGQTDAVWLHTTSLSTAQMKLTQVIGNKSQLQPGDLVYFGSVGTVHHVGIYEGSGACGKSDCFLEWYHSGAPGRSNSLANEPDYVGFVHIVLN